MNEIFGFLFEILAWPLAFSIVNIDIYTIHHIPIDNMISIVCHIVIIYTFLILLTESIFLDFLIELLTMKNCPKLTFLS